MANKGKSKALKWCDEEIAFCKLKYCLVTDEATYLRVMKSKGVSYPSRFISEGSSATTHTFISETEGGIALVCLDLNDSLSHPGIEIAGLLVHEAVHIWQRDCELRGEKHPSDEYEAYAIQIISQNLMWQYRDSLEKRPKK